MFKLKTPPKFLRDELTLATIINCGRSSIGWDETVDAMAASESWSVLLQGQERDMVKMGGLLISLLKKALRGAYVGRDEPDVDFVAFCSMLNTLSAARGLDMRIHPIFAKTHAVDAAVSVHQAHGALEGFDLRNNMTDPNYKFTGRKFFHPTQSQKKTNKLAAKMRREERLNAMESKRQQFRRRRREARG